MRYVLSALPSVSFDLICRKRNPIAFFFNSAFLNAADHFCVAFEKVTGTSGPVVTRYPLF